MHALSYNGIIRCQHDKMPTGNRQQSWCATVLHSTTWKTCVQPHCTAVSTLRFKAAIDCADDALCSLGTGGLLDVHLVICSTQELQCTAAQPVSLAMPT
jgi:hypothetical protein